MRVLLEVCCGSADDVIAAYNAGADRVELNSDLFHGGLTPTLGSLLVAKRETDIKVMTMVRPREGGFCYTDAEFAAAVEDAKLLLTHGADGLVFGFLQPDGRLNAERTRIIAELAKEAGKEAVFHRAIDVVPDWKETLDQLSEIGITRVLTSGQKSNALLGSDTIREMIAYAAGRLEILPGSGINLNTMDEVIATTGCDQIHLSGHRTVNDFSSAGNPAICFNSSRTLPEGSYRVVDGDYVRELKDRLGR